MEKYFTIFKSIIVGVEFIAALTGLIYFKSLKNKTWKVFAIYLVFIFLQELYFLFNLSIFSLSKSHYSAFIGGPIECILWYWVFAYKSLNKRKLFYLFSFIYLISIPIELSLKNIGVVFSLSFTIGFVFLGLLLILEFLKQIQSDEILYFKENKMFYTTIGVFLGYIVTFPFLTFNKVLYDNYISIWNILYVIFIGLNSIMYLLFAASFIWGKRQS